MASDAEKKELVDKLTRHVAARFGGTGSTAWQRAFTVYDLDHDDAITAPELRSLLSDAGIGNFLTLDAWVSGVIDVLDKDRSTGISYPELESVLVKSPASAPVYAQAAEAVARPDYLFPLAYTPAPRAAAPKPRAKAKGTPAAAPAPSSSAWLLYAAAAAAAYLLWRRR